jgi:hypothetical protein
VGLGIDGQQVGHRVIGSRRRRGWEHASESASESANTDGLRGGGTQRASAKLRPWLPATSTGPTSCAR